MDFAAFAADRKTVYAVTRALEIISEASRRLPDDVRSHDPAITWRAVAAAGNVYRHDYETVDEAIVWKTAAQDLDPLNAAAKAELGRVSDRGTA